MENRPWPEFWSKLSHWCQKTKRWPHSSRRGGVSRIGVEGDTCSWFCAYIASALCNWGPRTLCQWGTKAPEPCANEEPELESTQQWLMMRWTIAPSLLLSSFVLVHVSIHNLWPLDQSPTEFGGKYIYNYLAFSFNFPTYGSLWLSILSMENIVNYHAATQGKPITGLDNRMMMMNSQTR
jgi:hypothetical protein